MALRIFVTGATGVLGCSAIPRLVEAGHDVTGVARGDAKAEQVRGLGAAPVVVDIFDALALTEAVRGHEAVCHFASHIPAMSRGALRSSWRENDRIWTEAAHALVDAAIAAGVSAYIHQSSGFMYADGGDRWLDEDSPIDPPPHGAAVVTGEAEANRFADAGGRGISLRFGLFYGPTAGTTLDFVRMARRLHVSVPGRPTAYYTSIHTDDLGTSAVAALDAPAGVYNVTDDEPLTRREYAEAFARALGVKKLRVPRVPKMKRTAYLLRSQRVSNKRFKEATEWSPSVPSARDGWPAVVEALRPQ